MAKAYVVTAPDSIRGIYTTWAECLAKVSGVAGARYMGVTSMEKAQAILDGGIPLPVGSYAFTDGNADGGVGVVLVHQLTDAESSAHAISTSVHEVFGEAGLLGLESPEAVAAALADHRNILAEMAALYVVLRGAEPKSSFTVVHDYVGVAEWMDEGGWKAHKPVLRAVAEACRTMIGEGRLHVTFQHQKGHSSTWAGRDDFAYWNARADALATEGSRSAFGYQH
jgi:hypothetical protein